MKQKHILILSDIHQGGEWIATLRLIKATQKISTNKVRFSLVGYVRSYKPRLQDFENCEFITYSDAKRPFSFIKKLISDSVSANKKISRLMKVEKSFDAVLVTHYLFAFSLLLLRVKKIKIFFYFHGIKSVPVKKVSELNYRQIIIKLFERLSLLFSHKILVPSPFAENFIKRSIWPFGKLKHFYPVPLIVPEPFYKRVGARETQKVRKLVGVSKESTAILYSGRLSKYKGLKNLVVGFSEFKKKTNLSARLVIAYPSSSVDEIYLKQLRETIDELKGEFFIKLMADLPSRSLISLYRVADILVLASDIEMAPLSVMESFAQSTPVIGTKTGNIPDILSKVNPKLILKDNSSEEIYKKLHYYFTLPKDEVKKMRKKSFKISRGYKEKVSAQNFVKLIDAIDNNVRAE